MSGFFFTFIPVKLIIMKTLGIYRIALLVALLLFSAGLNAQVTVLAKKAWNESTIMVNNGDRIVIQASGTVTLDPNVTCSPGGLKIVSGPAHVLINGFNRGGLVCKVGKKGVPFYVGAQNTVNIAGTGLLYFGVNDDKVKNNSGEFKVTVTVN